MYNSLVGCIGFSFEILSRKVYGHNLFGLTLCYSSVLSYASHSVEYSQLSLLLYLFNLDWMYTDNLHLIGSNKQNAKIVHIKYRSLLRRIVTSASFFCIL